MRIALVHDWLTGMRGGEKCLEVLCRQFPQARLFTLFRVAGATSAAIERMATTTSWLGRLPGVETYYRHLLPLMPGAIERLRLPADVDLVVSLSHAVAKGVKPPQGVPHVCYCFTPARYAWHRRDDYMAGRMRSGPVVTARRLMLERFRRWDRDVSRRVTHFVAISQTVAERIHDAYGRPSKVIYPPVDTRFYVPQAAGAREDWYLCVSALVPYKRVDLAVEACRQMGRRLVVIGSGPERRRLARLADKRVFFAGWQTNEVLRDHLRRCRALVFTANEDFGIVPLEAQACGTPVIAFAEGGASETVVPTVPPRRGTGWFFFEQSAVSLCQALERFEAEAAWFSPELARQQAERFSVDRFEAEIGGYLDAVATGSEPPI